MDELEQLKKTAQRVGQSIALFFAVYFVSYIASALIGQFLPLGGTDIGFIVSAICMLGAIVAVCCFVLVYVIRDKE